MFTVMHENISRRRSEIMGSGYDASNLYAHLFNTPSRKLIKYNYNYQLNLTSVSGYK